MTTESTFDELTEELRSSLSSTQLILDKWTESCLRNVLSIVRAMQPKDAAEAKTLLDGMWAMPGNVKAEFEKFKTTLELIIVVLNEFRKK
jgi:hypothetical protein